MWSNPRERDAVDYGETDQRDVREETVRRGSKAILLIYT